MSSSLGVPLNAVESTYADDQADDASGHLLTRQSRRRDTLRHRRSYDEWANSNRVKLSRGSRMHYRLVQVVVAMAATASMVSFCVSFTVSYVVGLLEEAKASGVASPMTVQVVLTTLLLWGARLMVAWAPAAKGSGLPEIKCMLSGWRKKELEFVSCSTLVAKAAGLAMALSGGMPLGREGPFVHIAVCIGMQLMDFCQLLNKAGAREHLLQAAVAVGVAVTFTAPIAGLVFAMELMMPHLYDNGMKRISFIAAAVGTLVFKTIYRWAGPGLLIPLVSSDMPPILDDMASVQEALLVVACSALLGLLQGLLGGCFVFFHERMIIVVKALRGKAAVPGGAVKALRDMPLLAVLALVGAALQFGPECPLFGMAPGGAMSKHLFSVTSEATNDGDILLCVFIVRWVHCSVSLSMPVPSGCIAPLLMLGGISGRLYGRVVAEVFCPRVGCDESSPTFQNMNHVAAYFAVIGASSFCSAVCGCLSIVIVMYELIDLPRGAIIPLAIAHFIADWAARKVVRAPSIFDMPLKMAKLRALPTLNASEACLKSVSACMREMDRVVPFAVPRQCTSQDLQNLKGRLERAREGNEKPPSALPIVERLPALSSGGEHYVLQGAIKDSSLDDLAAALKRCEVGPAPGAGRPAAASSRAVDALVEAHLHDLLEEPLVVSPWISLRDAYIKAQTEHSPDGFTFMVRDGGLLVGLLTQDDLLGD